ncbi:hypothetical protein WKH56_07195 [Priestia sp. SB1]|uniref:hypothetical protein n=1 Tax=Priestia TaxID=2800373 RepID=UPI001DB4ABDE|nr:hypothetical protein [Priestia megaterium]
MKRILGYTSVVFFVLSATLWLLWFNDSGTVFSNEIDFVVAISFGILGMITAFFAKNNALAVVSFMGSFAIIFMAVIFPYLMSIIWKPIP